MPSKILAQRIDSVGGLNRDRKCGTPIKHHLYDSSRSGIDLSDTLALKVARIH